MKKNKQKFEENLEKKVSLLEKDLKPLTQEFYNRDVVTLAKELVLENCQMVK